MCYSLTDTTPRGSTNESPFNLSFRVEAVIPAEIGSQSLRNIAFDETLNDHLFHENLALLDEVREQAT